MIIVGVVLLIAGLVFGMSLLTTAGIIVLILGVALMVAGRTGHAVGGHSHYY